MTAEEYIVEDYQAIRLENLMLETQLKTTNEICDELRDIIEYILKHSKQPEKESTCRYISTDYIWEDENKEIFEKIVKILKKIKDEADE